MTNILSDWAREFLREDRVAVVSTLNKDGSPQVTTIWYLFREEGISNLFLHRFVYIAVSRLEIRLFRLQSSLLQKKEDRSSYAQGTTHQRGP